MSKSSRFRSGKGWIHSYERIRLFNEIKKQVRRELSPEERILTDWKKYSDFAVQNWTRHNLEGYDAFTIHYAFFPGWEANPDNTIQNIYTWTPGLHIKNAKLRDIFAKYEELYKDHEFDSYERAQAEVDNLLIHIGFKLLRERVMCLA